MLFCFFICDYTVITIVVQLNSKNCCYCGATDKDNHMGFTLQQLIIIFDIHDILLSAITYHASMHWKCQFLFWKFL